MPQAARDIWEILPEAVGATHTDAEGTQSSYDLKDSKNQQIRGELLKAMGPGDEWRDNRWHMTSDGRAYRHSADGKVQIWNNPNQGDFHDANTLNNLAKLQDEELRAIPGHHSSTDELLDTPWQTYKDPQKGETVRNALADVLLAKKAGHLAGYLDPSYDYGPRSNEERTAQKRNVSAVSNWIDKSVRGLPKQSAVDKEGRPLNSPFIYGRGRPSIGIDDADQVATALGARVYRGDRDPEVADRYGPEPSDSEEKKHWAGPDSGETGVALMGGGLGDGYSYDWNEKDRTPLIYGRPGGDSRVDTSTQHHELGHLIDARAQLTKQLAPVVQGNPDLEKEMTRASVMWMPPSGKDSGYLESSMNGFSEVLANNLAFYMENGDLYDRLFPASAALLRKYINENPTVSKVMTLSKRDDIANDLRSAVG